MPTPSDDASTWDIEVRVLPGLTKCGSIYPPSNCVSCGNEPIKCDNEFNHAGMHSNTEYGVAW